MCEGGCEIASILKQSRALQVDGVFLHAQQTVSPGMYFPSRFIMVFVRVTDSQPGDTFSP